jgi:hypothetical protein
MNILYFDERELWSPKIDEMVEDMEDAEIKTVNKIQMQQGKKLSVVVASYMQPDNKF